MQARIAVTGNMFPTDFLWRAAMAGYQTEGDICNNDWDGFTSDTVIRVRVARLDKLASPPEHCRLRPAAPLAWTARPSRLLELHSGPTHAVTAVRTVVSYLDGLSTVGMHERHLVMHVLCSPDGQRSYHHPQFLALVGEEVFGAWRMV